MMATTIRLSMLAALLIGEAAVAEDAQQLQIPELDRGETLEKLGFPAVTERLTGWTKFGKGKVYTLPVKAGQHVKITFGSKSPYAFMAIFDLASSDDRRRDRRGRHDLADQALLFTGNAQTRVGCALLDPDRAASRRTGTVAAGNSAATAEALALPAPDARCQAVAGLV
jgi:hypothetical protein